MAAGTKYVYRKERNHLILIPVNNTCCTYVYENDTFETIGDKGDGLFWT